jgi:hypothetical protein
MLTIRLNVNGWASRIKVWVSRDKPFFGKESFSTTLLEKALTENNQKVNRKTRGRLRVLAAIPCYNEALTTGSVVLKAWQNFDEVVVG